MYINDPPWYCHAYSLLRMVFTRFRCKWFMWTRFVSRLQQTSMQSMFSSWSTDDIFIISYTTRSLVIKQTDMKGVILSQARRTLANLEAAETDIDSWVLGGVPGVPFHGAAVEGVEEWDDCVVAPCHQILTVCQSSWTIEQCHLALQDFPPVILILELKPET